MMSQSNRVQSIHTTTSANTPNNKIKPEPAKSSSKTSTKKKSSGIRWFVALICIGAAGAAVFFWSLLSKTPYCMLWRMWLEFKPHRLLHLPIQSVKRNHPLQYRRKHSKLFSHKPQLQRFRLYSQQIILLQPRILPRLTPICLQAKQLQHWLN